MGGIDPYARFACVYDQPDHEEITRAFLKRAWPVIKARPTGTWVLELACGTGITAKILAARKVPVVGVDRSRQMLTIARKRCRGTGVRFVTGDLATFSVRERCTVATATGDVPNHMPSGAVLRRIFARVRTQLADGGILMFDSLRRFCYERYWTEQTYHMEGPGGDVVMECDWDDGRGVATCRMVGYPRQGRGNYGKFETTLTEYFHPTATIRQALADAGFRKIRPALWSPWPDQHLEPEMDRLFWTAHKA